jgi:hypothetical protein
VSIAFYHRPVDGGVGEQLTRCRIQGPRLDGWRKTDSSVVMVSWGTFWGEKGWFKIIRGGAYRPGTDHTTPRHGQPSS